MSEWDAPIEYVPTDLEPATEPACSPQPVVVLTVITCRCGYDADGFTEREAWRAFEDHIAGAHDDDAEVPA